MSQVPPTQGMLLAVVGTPTQVWQVWQVSRVNPRADVGAHVGSRGQAPALAGSKCKERFVAGTPARLSLVTADRCASTGHSRTAVQASWPVPEVVRHRLHRTRAGVF